MREIIDGEIVADRSLALLPPDVDTKVSALQSLDCESQARAVTAMLSHSRTGLLAAIAAQDLSGIVEFKAKASAIHEITKQLRLGKDMQLDATEFVRRAERGIGVAIREGQASGEIESRDSAAKSMRERGIGNEAGRNTSSITKPSDLAPKHELSGQNADGIYAFTDNVSDEQFEEALAEAKEEENLSRANVARKAKAKAEPIAAPDSTAPKAKPKQRPKGKKFDSAHIVRETSIALEGLVMGAELAYIDDLDTTELKPYIDSINASLRALTKFSKGLANV